MDPDQPYHRPSSTPLFHAIPTGTYTYRYRDAGTDTTIRTENQDTITSILNPSVQNFLNSTVSKFKPESESTTPASSTTPPVQEHDESLADAAQAETTDPILYRETTAGSNSSMTLPSTQPVMESLQTGAKGRARAREARKFAAARIMPSQGLVDAAKGLGGGKGIGGTVSYPPLTAEGYLVGEVPVGPTEERERMEGRGAAVGRPDEMLLVGCGMDYGRRSRERGLPLPFSSHRRSDEARFMIDGKWVSGEEAQRLLVLHPDGDSWRRNPEREERRRERSRLLNENAMLRGQVARLEAAAARRREEETLRDENARLREELRRLRDEAVHDDEQGKDHSRHGRDSLIHEDLWKDAGLGNQPRRLANRGNRVGASLMSQEVMVEHPSAGKGRAREREEKRHLQNLAREPSRSDSDSDNDKNGRRRRTSWRTRELTDSDEDQNTNGNKTVGDIDTSSDDEHHGRKSFRDAARVAALSHLPPDVLATYGPDRPPRIWREHSHEILVEAANGGGSKGRRREVNLKNEDRAGGRVRFRPPTGLVDAAKRVNGVDGVKDEDDEEKLRMWRREGEELAERMRVTLAQESRDAYSNNEQETLRGRSPDEALAKYAADRPPRMFRDGSWEILAEGDEAGRRRRREGAFRQQLPEPRFIPTRKMAEAAARVDHGENTFLSDKEEDKYRGGT